ncbi:MAG: hypothetical protein SGJ00_14490 [bacterium]|nr:hypothetical protein [bacterium]
MNQKFHKVIRQKIKTIFCLTIILTFSNPIYAQSDEDYENETGFFNDGMNESRFESNLNSSYSTERPHYTVKSSRESNNNSDYGTYQNTVELDLDVHKSTNSRQSSYGGGGGGGGGAGTPGVNNYNSPSAGINSTGGTPAIKHPDSGVPINPGDPDAPIDGGIGLLLGAGVAYGFKVMRKKKISSIKQNHS